MKKRILTGALLTACLMGLILYTYRHFEKGYVGEDFIETAWKVVDTTDADKDMHGTVSANTNEEYVDRLDIPVIKIDLLGYQTNDIKKAYFDKGNAGDVFEVVNVKTKETVLTGKIDSKKTADFSQLTECGTYYVEAPYIGRSEQFCIIENKYASLSVELYQQSLAYANKNQSDFEK